MAKDSSPEEREIIGNAFFIIAFILTKISLYNHDGPENEWQQARKTQIELSEIEMEMEKLRRRIDNLAERANSSERKF